MTGVEEALRGRVRSLLPSWAGLGLRWEGDGRPMELVDPEPVLLSPGAVARRRLEFRLGRAAAREALADAGCAPCAIPRGSTGEPVWPDGVVGAISHAGRLALAVVAPKRAVAGIGIDVERVAVRSESIDRTVFTSEERAWIEQAADDLQAWRRRISLFSAKEAIFKAVFPATGVWLDYHDAGLAWCETGRCFRARIPALAVAPLEVLCLEQADYVVTATWLLHGGYAGSERSGPSLSTGEGVS